MIHASDTAPTLVYPSDKQPLVVPINNGTNGWMIIPPSPLSRLRVTGPTGDTIIAPPLPKKSRPMLFGRLNFGLRKRSKPEIPYKDDDEPIPVAGMDRRKGRRGV
jgi:hypothetical protein